MYNLSSLKWLKLVVVTLLCCLTLPLSALANDLSDIRQRGILRHLGVPYAAFVRNKDKLDGLDVEIMQLFAKHLGVRYEYVPTSWKDALADLTGIQVEINGDELKEAGRTSVKGDVLANGLTILPVRKKLVNFSDSTFPTGVWLVARANSSVKPIKPTGSLDKDIILVKSMLDGRDVLSKKNTCLDPELYNLKETGAIIHYSDREYIDDIAQDVVDGKAEITLLDVPDALIALNKWPGEIKIIGPISTQQLMGVAFNKESNELLMEFNNFFKKIWNDGTYKKIVEKYYPSVFLYFSDYFNDKEVN